jgi:hypothetical protein
MFKIKECRDDPFLDAEEFGKAVQSPVSEVLPEVRPQSSTKLSQSPTATPGNTLFIR